MLFFLLLSIQVKGTNDALSTSYVPVFENEQKLSKVFDKLQGLQAGKVRKINIVHIGDSHIQADMFTNVVRERLQAYFGNGGYGFTFPYSIGKTNGTKRIKYTTNIDWTAVRNIEKLSSVAIGLGGIALLTADSNFYIKLNSDSRFDRIRVLSSEKESGFVFSQNIGSDGIVQSQTITANQFVYHKVKSGETLYRLSAIYKTSVDDIKRANGLQSNTIRLGQRIKIPRKGAHTRMTVPASAISAKDTLDIISGDYYVEYNSPFPIYEINILADKKHTEYNLSGIVIEDNAASGIIYHSIGVNGAKASDYNKYSLFFEQLSILNPDLVIVSLGTNESFGRKSTSDFMSDMQLLVDNIRRQNKNVSIIISTPPPSLFKRRLINTFLVDYVKQIVTMPDCAIWDLYSKTGGAEAPKGKDSQTLMGRDKVHYSQEGYTLHGDVLSGDFIRAYENYIKVKSSDEHEIEHTRF